jgi:uncharacterized protein (DUF1778 family)
MTTTLPRITARVDVETQKLLSKAAAIIGISSINSFVLSAAIEKAKQIVEREQMLNLSTQDAILLVESLDKPIAQHDKLKSAAARYHAKTS